MQSIRQFVLLVMVLLLLRATAASARVKQTSQGEERKMAKVTSFQLSKHHAQDSRLFATSPGNGWNRCL